MDIEEFARRQIAAGTGDAETADRLAEHIQRIKGVDREYALALARAVVTEVRHSSDLAGDLFSLSPADVSMGEFGVGSRGSGDFFAHRELARVIGRTGVAVGVDEMDDAGAVEADGRYIICTVDGMHSRLSDFPFLAGFHVTRATLRDIYVMGARPLALISDIHVADDGDVARIFDYTAGISAVSETMDVPLVTGSTLRIGGDMVLGSRMTGCVGAVGVAGHLTARKSIAPGDVLLMTEGAGGGTIATAAIYSGFPDVVEQTINLSFLRACEALLESDLLPRIHAMTDVTNGGLRGDVYEMTDTAGCRITVVEDQLRTLVQPDVLAMLDRLEIDYLGVSLDALLVVVPREDAGAVCDVVRSAGVEIKEIGYVEEGPPASILVEGGIERDFSPAFRESAYTPVKKVVDTRTGDEEEMRRRVTAAADAAIAKKNRVKERLREA
ncbi:MAG: AIR synthase-related protein [Methanomicrobiales archaeon]